MIIKGLGYCDRKKLLTYIITNILLFIVITYIIIFLFKPILVRHTKTAPYEYASYDVVLKGPMNSIIDELEGSKIQAKRCLEISTLWLDFKLESNTKIAKLSLYAINEKSLESVIDILIPKKLFINYENEIVKNRNAIFISRDLAKTLDVDCGDIVYNFVYGNYYVAGVFENCIKNSYSIDGVILENQEEILKTNEDYPLNFLFLDFLDKEKGIEYVKNYYFNQSLAFERYGDDWKELILPGEVESFRSSSYNIREISLKTATEKLNYNMIEITAHVAIGLSFILVIQIYDNHRLIKLNLKNLAVYRMLGYSYVNVFVFYFLKSLITQAIVVLTSLYFCKNYGWTYHYLSNAILITWIPIFFICIFFASLLIGYFSIRELNTSRLLQVLQSEE